jgi:hypothetical protein
VAVTEDFFGLNMLGVDPYAAQKAEKLQRFESMDRILQNQMTLGVPGGRSGGTGPRQRTGTPHMFAPYGAEPSATPAAAGPQMVGRQTGGGMMAPDGGSRMPTTRGEDPRIGALADMMMRRGRGGGYSPQSPGGEFGAEMPSSGPTLAPPNVSAGRNGQPGEGDIPPAPDGQFCPNGWYWDGSQCIEYDDTDTPERPPRPNDGPPGREGREFQTANGPYTNDTIPDDLKQLRALMGKWLSQNFSDFNPAYGGDMDVDQSPWMSDAAAMAKGGNKALSDLMGFSDMGGNLSGLMPALGHLLGGNAAGFDPTRMNNQMNRANEMTDSTMNMFGGGMGYAVNGMDRANPFMMHANNINNLAMDNGLVSNGRAPQIQSALDAIRSRGMMDIEDQTAQIREQYGSMGLGAGSDVAEAVARGSSRGIADIINQQSQLSAGINSQAADRMLQSIMGTSGQAMNIGNSMFNQGMGVSNAYMQGGQGVLGAAGTMLNNGQLAFQGGMGNAGFQDSAYNRMLQSLPIGQGMMNNASNFNIASAGVRGQAASQMPGMAGILAQLAQMDMQRQGNNIGMNYQDFVRSTTRPNLGTAAGYATGFPPQQPMIQGGGGGGWGMLGSIGGAIAGALPWATWLSDENLKEDVEEIKPITSRLKELPIRTWRYKGDPIRHIGPMAQDWQKTFGIGDGHSIALPDVLSVILGSLQEMAHA